MMKDENKLVKDSEIIGKSKCERVFEFVINRKSVLYRLNNDLTSLADIFPWLEWFSLFYLSINVMIFHIDRNFSTLEAAQV